MVCVPVREQRGYDYVYERLSVIRDRSGRSSLPALQGLGGGHNIRKVGGGSLTRHTTPP